AVQQLIQRCVLEESAGGRFRFVHDKLREATYAVIPPEQRRELHRRAAVMLEGWPGDTPRSYPLLAHHWTRAGVPAKAVEYLEKAGGWALASAAYRDRKSTRLNSSHDQISYAVFCLKKKNTLASR